MKFQINMHTRVLTKSRIMNTPVQIIDLDVNKIKFSGLGYAGNYYRSTISYDRKALLFKTGQIKMSQNSVSMGVDCMYIPLDMKQDVCGGLGNKLGEIDDMINSMHPSIFGNNLVYKSLSGLCYRACINVGENEGDNIAVKELKPKYCKINIDPLYTQLFISDNGVQKHVQTDNISDFSEHIRWGSIINVIVQVDNLWFEKNANQLGMREFGLRLFAVAIEVIPAFRIIGHHIEDDFMFTDNLEADNSE